MKQEHINFIRLRYSTLENIPPFILLVVKQLSST